MIFAERFDALGEGTSPKTYTVDGYGPMPPTIDTLDGPKQARLKATIWKLHEDGREVKRIEGRIYVIVDTGERLTRL